MNRLSFDGMQTLDDLCILILTKPGTINMMIGSCHIYIPNARIGQRVASGRKEMIEALQRVYQSKGYQTAII